MIRTLHASVAALLCASLCAQGNDERKQLDIEYGQPDQALQRPVTGDVLHMAPNPQVNIFQETHILLEGLILVPADKDANKVRQDHGVHIELGKGDYKALEMPLQPYLNRPIDPALIQQIKDTIADYFLKEKHKYIAVLVPVQDITDGVVVFQVLEGKIGTIQYKGLKWFSESTLSKALPLHSGDPVIEPKFMDYMSWINRNPFHKTQMVLQPGASKGLTDVIFITQERFPVRFYTGFDNTGFRPTDQLRLSGGMNWGNFLNIGDLVSYQYTASPDFSKLQSHVVSYSSFLPWRHLMTLFACYGSVLPAIPGFTSNGVDIQASGRYLVPFFPFYGNFLNHIEGGFDWKYITSNYFFTGLPDAPPNNSIVNVTQFMLAYKLQRNWKDQVLAFGCNMFASVWKNLLPYQTSKAYNSLRTGSHVRYAYLKTSLNYRYELPSKCIFSLLFRGQLASSTLPTSEQYGLGGADTVRGYFEQQYVADNALIFNLEFYSPSLSLFKAQPNQLMFLAFFDYAYGRNYTYAQPSLQAQNLFGIGPGIRYDIIPYMSLKMDYGFQLKGITGDHRTGRFHFSLIVSN